MTQVARDWHALRRDTANLFKPKTPVDDDKLFAGRIKQIDDILDAVYAEGGHAIIFGERGVGKTSLSRIVGNRVAPVLPQLRVTPISCGVTDDFYGIWGNALGSTRAKSGVELGAAFRKAGTPYAVYEALKELPANEYHIFIFDEFDRLSNASDLSLMADMMKHFSNNPLMITIIVVGVGETLTDLFGSHESIARCCSQIKMPRMSEEELDEILDDRLEQVEFTIEPDVRAKVRKLSQGLPGYVHLLGQLMLRSAIDRRSDHIEETDFKTALDQTLEKADQTARQDYLRAVKSPRNDNKYKEVLLACALAKSDEMGHFYAGDVREPYSQVRGKPMEITNFATNLKNLCSGERGPALIKSGERKRYQYRFANPLVQPLTIMQGVKDGLISFDQN